VISFVVDVEQYKSPNDTDSCCSRLPVYIILSLHVLIQSDVFLLNINNISKQSCCNIYWARQILVISFDANTSHYMNCRRVFVKC